MNARLRNEPALIYGLVEAIIALVIAFGLDLTAEQVGAIVAATAAILGLVTRSQVSPYEPEPNGVDL